MWQIISYVLFGISSLGILILILLCIKDRNYLFRWDDEEFTGDATEIRQPKQMAYIALGCALVFYLFLLAGTFRILGFRPDNKEDLSANVVFFAFFLLGFVLALESLNWKIELSEETFIHTNWRLKKRTYRYDEIEERELKSVSRFYKDGKFKFEISYFQDFTALSIRIKKAPKKREKEKITEVPTMKWSEIECTLNENEILINLYTIDAYISVFGLTAFSLSEIDDWLYCNYENSSEELKNAVDEFFIAEDKERFLSSYCVDTAQKKVGLKCVRYATIKSTMEKLGDDPAENYVMISDCLDIFHKDTDLPNFLYGASSTEAIEKEIRAINLWLKNEKYSIKGSSIL